MTDPAEEENSYDPFSTDIELGQSITLMRIYDVLLAIYTQLNPEGGNELNKWHSQGIIVSSLPEYRMDIE